MGIFNKIKSAAFVNVSGSILSSGFGFLIFAVLARVLSLSDFGVWAIFLTTYTFFDLIRAGLVQNALVNFVSSTKNPQQKLRFEIAAWKITSLVSILAGLIFLAGYWVNAWAEYRLFFLTAPLLAIITVPFNMALWLSNARENYSAMQKIRLISLILFFVFLSIGFFVPISLFIVYGMYVLSLVISSIISLILGWYKIPSFFQETKTETQHIIAFGKFSMGTLIGANLLRSSDTYLIALFLGNQAVALYNVAQRLLELFELPVRSFGIAAYPIMARLHSDKDKSSLKNYFEQQSGFLTLIIFFISLFVFVFAEHACIILGGAEYVESASILRWFLLFCMVLPFDRYTGIALDAIQQPKRNMQKVILMLSVNIIGDIIVLKYFESVEAVAANSFLAFLTGSIAGFIWLRNSFNPGFISSIKEGFNFSIKQINKLRVG